VLNPETEYFVTDVGWSYPIGLPVYRAVEVLNLTSDQICPLPAVHPALLGVMGWRGQLLWTIALDSWLGIPQEDSPLVGQPSRPVLVLSETSLGRNLGCLVKKLHGIETIALEDLAPLPKEIPPPMQPYLRGKVQDSNLLVLDDRQLFQPEHWAINLRRDG